MSDFWWAKHKVFIADGLYDDTDWCYTLYTVFVKMTMAMYYIMLRQPKKYTKITTLEWQPSNQEPTNSLNS